VKHEEKKSETVPVPAAIHEEKKVESAPAEKTEVKAEEKKHDAVHHAESEKKAEDPAVEEHKPVIPHHE